MHSILRGVSRTLIYPFAATLFVAVVHAQSVLGPPNEANHFIATPKGWTQPKTPWGDPDIQGMWPISFVGSVPLERCAGGGGRGRAGSPPPPPCDTNKAFLTDAEYQQRLDAAAKQVDRHAEAIASGNFGQALQTGVTDPTAPQRQTSLIVDPPNGKLPEMTAEGKRLSALMKSSWALPGETQVWDSYLDFDTLGSLHHARHALVDDAVSLQQRRPHHAGAGLRDSRPRDGARDAHRPGGWPPGAVAQDQAVDGRIARTLGGQHARHRDDELQGRGVGNQHRRDGISAGESIPDERADEDYGAHHAAQRQRPALRDQDRGSGDPRRARGRRAIR